MKRLIAAAAVGTALLATAPTASADPIYLACMPVICENYPDLYCYNDGTWKFCI